MDSASSPVARPDEHKSLCAHHSYHGLGRDRSTFGPHHAFGVVDRRRDLFRPAAAAVADRKLDVFVFLDPVLAGGSGVWSLHCSVSYFELASLGFTWLLQPQVAPPRLAVPRRGVYLVALHFRTGMLVVHSGSSFLPLRIFFIVMAIS
jgi:hypothetical protein